MKTPLSFFFQVSYTFKFTSWRLGLSLVLLLYLCFIPKSLAQNKLWDKTIGGNGGDQLTAMQQTSDGGYILGGTSGSGISGDKSEKSRGGADYWVVKLNANGSKAWDKTFGGNNIEDLQALQQTRDGGYVLSGFSQSNKGGDKSENSQGGSDFWIVKIKPDGTKQWDKTFGGRQHEFSLILVRQTPDGGYVVGGSSLSGISGDKTEASRGNWDYWLVKLKADGTKTWDKTYGGKNEEYLSSLELSNDGGFILSGSSTSGRSGDKTQASKGEDDYWVVKTDQSGNILWDKTIGGNGGESGESQVQQTPDGGYILGGYSKSNQSGDKTENNRGCDADGNCRGDFWVVKLTANGSKEWDKTYGGNNGEYFKSLQQTQDGGFVLGGWSNSNKSGDKTEDSKGESDFWIVKINSDGTKQWDKTFGGNDVDDLYSIQQTRDGNYILGGTSFSKISGDKTEANRGCEPYYCYADYWIVKINNNGTNIGQNITFAPILYKTLGDAPFTLNAKSSSGLPVTYAVVSGPATIKGNILTVTGTSTVTVKASAAGNTTYLPADTTQTFVVETATLVKKEWETTLGGYANENLRSVAPTSDGGYILGGNSGSGKSGNKSDTRPGVWIVKLRADGTKEWDKVITDRDIAVLQPTPDGGYILGGSTEYNNNNFSSPDYWLVKLKADGTKEWEKVLGGYDWDELTALQQTQDGGYILGGTSYSGKGLDKSEVNRGGSGEEGEPVSDYWVVKVNASGTKEWDKTLGGDYYDYLTSLQQTQDGGYIVGGTSQSGLSGDKTEENKTFVGYSDYWIIKLKADGTKVWDKTIGGNDWDELVSVQPTPDGGYILAGSSSSETSGDKSEPNNGSAVGGFMDFWVVKLDTKRNKVWDRTLGGTSQEYLSTLLQTPDGSLILGGYSHSSKSGDKSQVSRGDGDIWLIKIEFNGIKVWDKTLGGDREDGLTALQSTPDGGYILGGNSRSNRSGDKSENRIGESDYWIVKLTEEQSSTASWNMRYGGSGKDNLTTVIKTTDGGYLSGGYTNSEVSGDKSQLGQGKNDYWVVKSNKNGKKLWDKRYGGSEDDYLNRVIQTQDGGYLLAGSSVSGKSGDKTESSRGNRDYWIIKTDKNGNQQWDKSFGGSGYDELKKVIQLASGEYVLGGHSNFPAGSDKTQANQGGTDYWILKISQFGNLIWDKRYGGTQNETLGSFIETPDGGFLLGGSSLSGKSGDKSQPSQGVSDYWVVKTDKNGNLLWEKTYGGSSTDVVYSIGKNNNHYYLAGTSSSGNSGDKSQKSQGGKDYWLVTLDQNGTKLWDGTFGSSKDDELRASTINHQGHYVLGGHSSSDVSGDKTQTSQGASDYWVITVDKDGNKLADQCYGGSEKEELRTITSTKDGGLLLAGRSNSGVSGDRTQPSQGGTDYWLVKVAPTTNSLLEARIATLPKAALVKLISLTAYPNPFSSRANIHFTLPKTQQVILKVFDHQGREITTLFQSEAIANHTYQLEWQASKQATGLYFLQLHTPTYRQQQKLLLIK